MSGVRPRPWPERAWRPWREAAARRSLYGVPCYEPRRQEMNYRLAYALGFHPWEALVKHQPYAGALFSLVARDEDASGRPFGSALDLGTGSAVWGVELAKRGWDVTGVDNVDKALGRARARIEVEGVEMRVVQGDVTALTHA